MADLENRFKGFITEGEKKTESSDWKPQTDKVKTKKIKGPSKTYHPSLFLLIMVILATALVGGGYVYINQIPKSNVEQPNLAEPTTENTSSPTPAGKISKDKVKVLVLNATGIRGQAGKVQVSLEEIGYKLIDVDTADQKSELTVIEYQPNILTEDLVEIETLLKKTYKTVELKENTAITGLKITTGKLK